jgi:hypothetical protein
LSIKVELLRDAIQRLRSREWLASNESQKTDEELIKEMLFDDPAFFDESKLFDVIEFGRSVHAEMAALSQAARVGTAVQDARLICNNISLPHMRGASRNVRSSSEFPIFRWRGTPKIYGFLPVNDKAKKQRRQN